MTTTVPQPVVIITETAYAGQSLTANISYLGGLVNYQWKRNGIQNIGTNNNTYMVQNDDFGSNITVTASLSGDPGSVTSNPYIVQKAGIGIGDPSIKLFLNDSPLENGGTTALNQKNDVFIVSITPGIYTEIIWYLNGSVVAQGAARTSITLSKQTPGVFHVTVEATPAGGVKDSGSHSFVIQ